MGKEGEISMNLIIPYCQSKYYGLIDKDKILREVQEKIDPTITVLDNMFSYMFNKMLITEPCIYWDKIVYEHTKHQLESNIALASTIEVNEKTFEYFLMGLNSYNQITESIQDLHDFNIDDEIKTRLYYLPIYTSILEGCISNFLRVFAAIIGQTCGKDYTNQHTLGSLIQIMNANGYTEITNNLDVNVRNAINHGKTQLKRQAISSKLCFYYVEQNIAKVMEINLYEFESMIEKLYDTASALLLVLIRLFNANKNYLKIDMSKNEYIQFSIFAMELSIPGVYCRSISDTGNDKQINIEFEIDNADRTFIAQTVSLLSIIVYKKYNQYQQYMFHFSNPRMQGGWIRYKNQELLDVYNNDDNFATALEKVIARKDFVYFEPSSEKVDLNDVKYFCFPNYSSGKFKINRIADASLPDRKRLKACLYIGDETDKEEILQIILEAIAWLKTVKNPPSPTLPHKYGDTEADSLYINVYRRNERKSRELYSNNENFVCFVDYNYNGETTLKNGGLPQNIWNSFYHEKIDKIQIAWRESKYIIRKVNKIGVNQPCPCGSGLKFKKCCKGKGIYDK